MDLYSASEPKLARKLFLKELSEESGKPVWELEKYRTYRDRILINDCLLSSISFTTPTFQNTHQLYKNLIVNPEFIKGAFNHEIKYKGMDITFALGGIHGSRPAKVYEANDEYIIMSSDVNTCVLIP